MNALNCSIQRRPCARSHEHLRTRLFRASSPCCKRTSHPFRLFSTSMETTVSPSHRGYAAAAGSIPDSAAANAMPDVGRALLCSSITADTVADALDTIATANSSGADLLELRLDFYGDFDAQQHLKPLMHACQLPFIVTFRPVWEGCALVLDRLLQLPQWTSTVPQPDKRAHTRTVGCRRPHQSRHATPRTWVCQICCRWKGRQCAMS